MIFTPRSKFAYVFDTRKVKMHFFCQVRVWSSIQAWEHFYKSVRTLQCFRSIQNPKNLANWTHIPPFEMNFEMQLCCFLTSALAALVQASPKFLEHGMFLFLLVVWAWGLRGRKESLLLLFGTALARVAVTGHYNVTASTGVVQVTSGHTVGCR